MSIVLFALFTVSLTLIVIKYWRRLCLGLSLPGPWAIPMIGNLQMIGRLQPEKIREKFGKTYRLWVGPQLWVFLHTAEEAHDALVDNSMTKPDAFKHLEPLIGNGLLLSHGITWTKQRRMLTPAFQPRLLRTFLQAINLHADRLLRKLEDQQGKSIKVTDALFACYLDTVVDTCMGRPLVSQTASRSIYTVAFHRTSEMLFKRMTNPLLGIDFIFKRTWMYDVLKDEMRLIHELMRTMIVERKAELQKRSEKNQCRKRDELLPLTLLDTLLEARAYGCPLPMQVIMDEVNTFVFAGVDTTTAALSFVLYALAKYPLVQARLYQELGTMSGHQFLNGDSPQSRTYLDMVVREVLRLYTIVPTTGRKTTRDTRIGNRTYCAGITLWINMYGLAHDPAYFPQPYEFRPERWADGAPELPNFSYIPFSGGGHVCIGRRFALMLIKVLTTRIVRRFHLYLGDDQKPLVLQAQMVLKARDGINIIFQRRQLTPTSI